MVYYLVAADGHVVYMGKDKYENEELIKWGWPEDVWFHVDSLSSAHVYVRLNAGEDWRSMPKELVHEMCQLVKDNSIEGCKKEKVDIVYTPCHNLKKTQSMDVGQVSYKVSKGTLD
jgi:predicted ribosome quality control (RQC) complex YloA/Tae2 family protein